MQEPRSESSGRPGCNATVPDSTLDATSVTPQSLLQRIRDENSESDWRQLYLLYAPLIRRWLGTQGIFEPDADDFTQEVFKTLVKELPDFEHNGRVGAFRNWLRTTLVFRLKAHSRSRGTRARLSRELTPAVLDELEDPASAPSEQWDREHDQFVMRQLLDLIEPKFRASTWQAFRRQVLDGISAKKAAEELGISVNAALIGKSRVLRRLREEARGLVDDDAAPRVARAGGKLAADRKS